jgi:S-disulfanyl-L-cysteine oxidoreductase SoxD
MGLSRSGAPGVGRGSGPAVPLLLLLCVFCVALGTSAVSTAPAAVQQTTRDKIYAKAQAAHGAELYVKYCERCHDPAKVPAGKKPGPPVTGEKFIDKWQDHTLGELFASIFTTMPSDGSAVLSEAETLDLVAYLVSANGFPEGPAPLKNDDAMKATVIVKRP